MRKHFQPFTLEREMGIWEHRVRWNLSESGVHPLTVSGLLEIGAGSVEEMLSTELNYPHTNGSLELREAIAALYPGAAPGDVLATTGAAQANFTALLTMLDPGDEIVVMLPNYMQIWGAAKNLGLEVRTFSLRGELGWCFDPDELRAAVTPDTRLIAVCNPNNPTGHIMTDDERRAVIEAASDVGAWILSDEVYAGAEHEGGQTPSLWGEYEKVLAIGSMSKAYALPGLRLGWVVSNPEMSEALWARQDYITICPTVLANRLAAHALSQDVRPHILERTRSLVRNGFSVLQEWVQEHGDMLSLVPPGAAAIGFVHYNQDVNSSDLVQRLIHEHETYVVPGDHFGMDRYLRISYGLSEDYVREGLRRVYLALNS